MTAITSVKRNSDALTMGAAVIPGQGVHFGIVGFGYAFGGNQEAGFYVTDPERVLRWGYHTFHRAADGVTATALAAEAARDAGHVW